VNIYEEHYHLPTSESLSRSGESIMQPTPLPKSVFRRSLSLYIPIGLVLTGVLMPAGSARAQGAAPTARAAGQGRCGLAGEISVQPTVREDRQLGLAAALEQFFRTANLVDQALMLAEQHATEMRRAGVIVRPLPEVGQLDSQVRLMTLVRTYLRAQGSVGGVSISSVDLPLPVQELVQVLIPQSAIYLNSFALEQMRTLSDATPQFPEALRAVLKTTRLIHEPPPKPEKPEEQGAPPGSPGAAFQGLVDSLFGLAAPAGARSPAGPSRPAAPSGPATPLGPPVPLGPGR
jgi:hypothetical protein